MKQLPPSVLLIRGHDSLPRTRGNETLFGPLGPHVTVSTLSPIARGRAWQPRKDVKRTRMALGVLKLPLGTLTTVEWLSLSRRNPPQGLVRGLNKTAGIGADTA